MGNESATRNAEGNAMSSAAQPGGAPQNQPVSFTARPMVVSRVSRAELCPAPRIRRNLKRDEKVAGENIVVKVIQRRRRMKLAGRDPSVRIGPLPAAG